MTFWEALAVAAISAAVSFATVLALRWWDNRKVSWVVTGEAFEGYEHGRPTGLHVASLEVHNAGDGDAYDVRITRCNGGTYEPWETFESGKIPAGGSIPVTFNVKPENWESAWFEIIYQPTPVGRRKPIRSRRYPVGVTAGRVASFVPSPEERRRRQGRGKQLPETP